MLSDLADAGPLVVVDGGNALGPPRPPRVAGLAQARSTAAVIAEAFAAGPLDAMALGEQDWALGGDWVGALVAERRLPVLAANLVCPEGFRVPGGRVVQREGRRIGLVGVTDGVVEGCRVTDPEEAAGRALEALGPVDVSVLLAPLPPAVLDGWSGPAFDFVVDGTDPIPSAHGRAWGSGWRVGAGSRGRQIGVIDLGFTGGSGWRHADGPRVFDAAIARAEADRAAAVDRATGSGPLSSRRAAEREIARIDGRLEALREARAAADAPDGRQPFRVRLVALSDDVGEHPATAAIVAGGIAAIGEVEAGPEGAVGQRLAPEGSGFAGAAACRACHPGEHAQWAGTAHARAWSTLDAAGRGRERRCLPCHVTGWEAEGGPATPAAIGPFRDVQCEACHGPARAHAANPAVAVVRDPGVGTCHACHDGDRDGGRFVPEAYRARIDHAGASVTTGPG